MQNAAHDPLVFVSTRRLSRKALPSEHAGWMRAERAAGAAEQAARQGAERLSDRIEQLEYTTSYMLDGDDGMAGRFGALDARLARLEDWLASEPDRGVTARLDRLSELLASLSVRAVQSIPATPVETGMPAAVGDLDRLQGVGPGLIRMLEKVGLTRVDELACADPDRLRDALGPVGDVLDIGFLVSRARDMATPQPSVPVTMAEVRA